MIDWNFVEIVVLFLVLAFVIGHVGERVQQMVEEDKE